MSATANGSSAGVGKRRLRLARHTQQLPLSEDVQMGSPLAVSHSLTNPAGSSIASGLDCAAPVTLQSIVSFLDLRSQTAAATTCRAMRSAEATVSRREPERWRQWARHQIDIDWVGDSSHEKEQLLRDLREAVADPTVGVPALKATALVEHERRQAYHRIVSMHTEGRLRWLCAPLCCFGSVHVWRSGHSLISSLCV